MAAVGIVLSAIDADLPIIMTATAAMELQEDLSQGQADEAHSSGVADQDQENNLVIE